MTRALRVKANSSTKLVPLQSLDAIIGSAPSCPTATRRSARRVQTLDSLCRTLAAVAESFPGSRDTPASGRAEKSRGALVRRFARAPPIRRRSDPKTALRSSLDQIRRRRDTKTALRSSLDHGQPVGQGGRRRAAARLAAAARERAHPADGPTARIRPTASRRAGARYESKAARSPDATQSRSTDGRRLRNNE